jgi:hypothetical protein
MGSVLLLSRWFVGRSFESRCTHFLIAYCDLSEGAQGAVFMLTSFSRFSAVVSWYCCLCLWKAGFFCVCELASRLDEALHKLSGVFPLISTPCCICAISRKWSDSAAGLVICSENPWSCVQKVMWNVAIHSSWVEAVAAVTNWSLRWKPVDVSVSHFRTL